MKISIITRHAISNYGSILQTYATQKAINKIGHDSEIINYIREEEKGINIAKTFSKTSKLANKNIITKLIYIILQFPNLYLMDSRFSKYRNKYLKQTPVEYHSNKQLKENLPEADVYCTGSDQVWGNIGTAIYDPAYFLEFVPQGKKCITYAASFGKDKIEEHLIEKLPELTKKYSKLLIREDTGVDILQKYTNKKNIEQVLDPTLLLTKEEWNELGEKIKLKENSYILVYQLHHNKFFDEYLKKVSKLTKLPIIRINPSFYFKFKFGKFEYLPTPGQFITYFKNAKYVITDSFHGTVFSIIYNKKFVDILPNKTSTRIESILKLVGLEKRIIKNLDEVSWLDDRIDYKEINIKLASERKKSIELLRRAIED